MLPLASESRELVEPLIWEPFESMDLPEGKGSLGAGERQRGIPSRMEYEPVGESRLQEACWNERCGPVQSVLAPQTEPASDPCARGDMSPGKEKLLTLSQLQ